MTVNYEPVATGKDHCQECSYFTAGVCTNPEVAKDPDVPASPHGGKAVSPQGWCKEFDRLVQVDTPRGGGGDVATGSLDGPKEKNMKTQFRKFVPFAKVDE